MNSDKKQKLPEGWVLCTSKSNPGKEYYFNTKTGKSLWTKPKVGDKSCVGKSKCKKEKHLKEKCKKEEHKKNLKRKCDEGWESSSKKKNRGYPSTSASTSTPLKQSSSTKETVTKLIESKNDTRRCVSASKTVTPESSTKKTPTKNIASSRLSQLRARLSAELQDESPTKKARISPNATHTEMKAVKPELVSPNLNETKCSTTQSPSSDSIQSIPSPSQFFAANKIISSIKAQLPEEYCNKPKQKDTFADIEQGICNQTAEYPFMKHPATPPQFSEASKLVSAINSKLTYKIAGKDATVTTFASAKDRLESLRTRLSNEAVMEANVEDNLSGNMKNLSEAMDVDFKEVRPILPVIQMSKDYARGSNEDVVLVVDTNIFIHELDFIKNVLNSHIKGYSEQPTLLVPWRVINELDRLKDNNNGNGAICKRAKAAMDYLYKSLPENNRIKGQSLRDANSHIYPCEIPDDEILNCSLQQAERGKSVILLSNDKNLCNKAVINNIKCIALNELSSLLEHKPQPTTDPDLYTSVTHYKNTMCTLLANILENEMRAKYNNLWQHVLFKEPPWTLADVLQCLLKHWIAVFNDVFPRIEHLITELRNTLACIDNKGPTTLSRSEVSNFKELCLDIAKKCQIIPEYMELAKMTVDRLLHERPGDSQGGEMVVIDAFEGLWTVFSSYCAKLSSGLGVAHSLEDKLPGSEPLTTLIEKLDTFHTQISALTQALKGVLNKEVSSAMADEMVRLGDVVRDSLTAIGKDNGHLGSDILNIFITNCRNMLQEALAKFTQLTELLDVCKNNIRNQM